MKNFFLAITLATTLIAATAWAKLAKDGTPVGKWHIYSELDAMTDAKSCVAYYEDGNNIQLTTTSFAISYRGRGGLDAYTLRFDNDPPLGMSLPSRTEKHHRVRDL